MSPISAAQATKKYTYSTGMPNSMRGTLNTASRG
jgi:hypothetical protein